MTKRKLRRTFLTMAIQTSRSRKARAKRTFQGEDEARFLLLQMNDGRMVHRDTLQEIVLTLQSLQPITPITGQRGLSCDPSLKEQTQRIEDVNRILRQYEAVPVITQLAPMSGSGFKLAWRRTGDSATRNGQTKGSADSELSAALIAVRLAEQGRINALRQCPNCTRWLFAKFAHSRFCSEDCKNNFHREDPDEKKRRREWAKNNYRLHKTKNIK